jgi:hypothetical protein
MWHVWEHRMSYKVLIGKLEVKILLGNLYQEEDYNIKMGFKEMK